MKQRLPFGLVLICLENVEALIDTWALKKRCTLVVRAEVQQT